jgi:hypothetical protein
MAGLAVCLSALFLVYCYGQSLEDKVYKNVEGNACVWMLNLEGGVGCHSMKLQSYFLFTLIKIASKSGVYAILKQILNENAFDKFMSAEKTSDDSSYILVAPQFLLGYKKY